MKSKMKCVNINLSQITSGKLTYPSWSNKAQYVLESETIDENNIIIYYITKSNRKISRKFPKEVNIDIKSAYILGLIKGEGANALGNSNYRRFTFTNTDWTLIKQVLNMLEETKLFFRKDIVDKSTYILHHKKSNQEAINYWSDKLNIPKSKFKCFEREKRTKDYGVCHIYISDVLLRRVIDLIIEHITNQQT